MIPPDDISAGLPAPRDDEPHELRGDIADELADHLACSLARERLRDEQNRGRSEEELFGEVFDRFGDPRQVARRLWWDAMKEKIMAQRLMTGVTLVAAAASIAAVVLLTQLVANNREEQKQLLGAQREWMQAMLAEMRKPREPEKDADQFSDWQPLRVKLVDEDGNPVQGAASCNGKPVGMSERLKQSANTNSDGTADFGRLPPGNYGLIIWASATNEHRSDSILLGPGRTGELTIRCPGPFGDPLPVKFELAVPEDLAKEPLFFVGKVFRDSRRIDGVFWSPVGQHPVATLVFDSHGNVLGELPEEALGSNETKVDPLDVVKVKAVTFPVEILSSQALVQPRRFVSGMHHIEVSAYRGDPVGAGDERPTLHSLDAGSFNARFSVDPSRDNVVRIAYDNGFWWTNVTLRFKQPGGGLGGLRGAAMRAGGGGLRDRAQPVPPAAGVSDLRPLPANPKASDAAPEPAAEGIGPSGLRGAAIRTDDPLDGVAKPTTPYPMAPPATPQAVPVRINIATPNRLKNAPVWFLIQFIPQPSIEPPTYPARLLLVDSKGEVHGELPRVGPGWEHSFDVQSASGASITFPSKLPQRVPLLPYNGLSLGGYDVIAVPYLAARNESMVGVRPRPTMEVINGKDVFLARLNVTAKEAGTITIGAEQTEFWDGIEEALRDRTAEKAAEAQ